MTQLLFVRFVSFSTMHLFNVNPLRFGTKETQLSGDETQVLEVGTDATEEVRSSSLCGLMTRLGCVVTLYAITSQCCREQPWL